MLGTRVLSSRRALSTVALAAVRAGGGVKLDKVAAPTGALAAGDVSLKFLLSPIHKADIQGGVDAKSLGIEGLAEVSEVGSGVRSLKKGDWVVPPLGFGESRLDGCLRWLCARC